MEEGEVVEGFDAEGGAVCSGCVAAEECCGGEEECGADAFAAESEGVVDGGVEFLWFGEELFLFEELLYFVEVVFKVIHILISVVLIRVFWR